MIKITMYSSADKVAGQGVGSAYTELLSLLKDRFDDQFDIQINEFNRQNDISHYHTIDPRFFISTFSKRRGKKIGYVHFLPETMEGSLKIPQPFRGIFYHYLISFYKRMDHLVVVNPSFIPKLAAYGIDSNKVTYIPNFVDDQRFYPVTEERRRQLYRQWGLDDERFTVVGSGQIQERKGVFDFIQLARQNPAFQFIWAGGFSFGRITDGYQELKKVVANPPANLKFPGIVTRDQIAELNNIADLFLLPSYNELFPMSVLEAFSCGTPVMLRDLDLYHSIIDGYYLPAKDVNEMQAQLERIAKDPVALDELRQKSLTAAQRYSKDHLAAEWHHFYRTQAGGK
ncbi:MAG: glycosyltransferase family 4 protein [Limosilactobacillus gorillae]|uniref:glycosyltransferase family 4 protein n=1 Tax=Limosilactobacillus gorillae TaxID=1450649 RepID=UPI000B0B2BCB|nr:glycosyltransferase family 4 protein [Limosilactobacillus gorillae]MDO4856128.1 glycosyltransferase family 4 protein [Limosilactobacillus gorillae]